MKIERCLAKEKWVVNKIREWLNKQPRSEGWHVSDLLYPRKAYWKRTDPQPMTDTEALYFVAGQGHHFIIESIIEGSKKTGKADAGSHEWRGIHYSPDIRTPHPLEIKTSRSKYGPKVESERSYLREYEHYLKQLGSYMAIDEDDVGGLLVFYLNKEQPDGYRSLPELRWYDVKLEPGELGKTQAELLSTVKALAKALKTKKPRTLPLCPAWMCRNCSWLDKCKPWLDDEKRRSLNAERRVKL